MHNDQLAQRTHSKQNGKFLINLKCVVKQEENNNGVEPNSHLHLLLKEWTMCINLHFRIHLSLFNCQNSYWNSSGAIGTSENGI